MDKRECVFARIAAAGDGFVYVILKNCQCCTFTVACFRALLKDPMEFLRGGFLDYVSPTGYPVALKGDLMKIPGLTLAVLTDERKLLCDFPEIISLSLLHALQGEDHVHININEVFCGEPLLDRKQGYLEVFLALGTRRGGSALNEKFNLSIDTQNKIVSEILGSRFPTAYLVADSLDMSDMPQSNLEDVKAAVTVEGVAIPFASANPPAPSADLPAKPSHYKELPDYGVPEHYISLTEYSHRYSVTTTTLHRWITNQWVIAPAKDALRRWWLDPNDTPEMVRARNCKTVQKAAAKKQKTRLKGKSYEDVQSYIKGNGLFPDSVRPYIRTYEEAMYYVENRYRVVEWYGHYAFIIDVHLDYVSKKHQKTNRELIAEGFSPVVPDRENQVFHLHHVGQKLDSPIAILPEGVHIGKEMTSVFHPAPSSDENLHSTAFDLQRKKFWMTYVQFHDKYSGYNKIPYLNHKQKSA